MSAILVECLLRGMPSRIEELRDLAMSRGYMTVKEIVQRRGRLDPSFVVGRGKVKEIKEAVEALKAEHVIFANDLKAGQAFRLRREIGWNVNVIDRNLLILEIFEQRAMTNEAKLQIELARLKYTLPWTREFIRNRNLYGEQVGFGALGEYLHRVYEEDIRKRINRIERRLREARGRSISLMAKRRRFGFQIVALTGYTQGGKTTFFNKVVGESKPIGLGPFTTLGPCARKASAGGFEFILIDSIGFIEGLHPLILDAFHTTLNEIALSDLILIFIDASESDNVLERKVKATYDVLSKFAQGISTIICLNKIDLINSERLSKVESITRKYFTYQPITPISVEKGVNIDLLMDIMKQNLVKIASTQPLAKTLPLKP